MAAAYPDDTDLLLTLFALDDLGLKTEYEDEFRISGITDRDIHDLMEQSSEIAMKELKKAVPKLKLGHSMKFIKAFEAQWSGQQLPMSTSSYSNATTAEVVTEAQEMPARLEQRPRPVEQPKQAAPAPAATSDTADEEWFRKARQQQLPPKAETTEVRDSDIICQMPLSQQPVAPRRPVRSNPVESTQKSQGHAEYRHLDNGMPPPPPYSQVVHPDEKKKKNINKDQEPAQPRLSSRYTNNAQVIFDNKRKTAVEKFIEKMSSATQGNQFFLEPELEGLLNSTAEAVIARFRKDCGNVFGVDTQAERLKGELTDEMHRFRVTNEIKRDEHYGMMGEEIEKLREEFEERLRQLLNRENYVTEADFSTSARQNLKLAQDSFRKNFGGSPLYQQAEERLLNKLGSVCPYIDEEIKNHNLGIETEKMRNTVVSMYEKLTNEVKVVEDLEAAHSQALHKINEACKGKQSIFDFGDMPSLINQMKLDKTLELEDKNRRLMATLSRMQKMALEMYQQLMQNELGGVGRPVAKPVLAALNVKHQKLVTEDFEAAFAEIQNHLKNAPQQLERCLEALVAHLNTTYTSLEVRNESYRARHQGRVTRALNDMKEFCALEMKKVGTPDGYPSFEAVLAVAEKDFDKAAELRLFEPRYVTNARDELLNFGVVPNGEEPELARLAAATEALNLDELLGLEEMKIDEQDSINEATGSDGDNACEEKNDDLVSEDSFEALEGYGSFGTGTARRDVVTPTAAVELPDSIDLLVTYENGQLQLHSQVMKRLHDNALAANAKCITFFAAVDQNFSPNRTLTEAACLHLGHHTTEDYPEFDEKAFSRIATSRNVNGVAVLLQPFIIKNHKNENVAVFVLDAQADSTAMYTALVDVCLTLSSFTVLALSGASSDVHWNLRNSCVDYGLETLHFLIHDIPLTGRELNTPAFRDTHQTQTILANSTRPDLWQVIEKIFPACNATSRCFLKNLTAEDVHQYFDMHIIPGIDSSITNVELEKFSDQVVNKLCEINNHLRRRENA